MNVSFLTETKVKVEYSFRNELFTETVSVFLRNPNVNSWDNFTIITDALDEIDWEWEEIVSLAIVK